MKLIIAGGRSLGNRLESEFIEDLVMEFDIGHPDEVISGGCSGIDFLRENYCISNANAKLTKFPTDWDKYGKAAGPIRNREMAKYGDALLLIWDGKSRGSANMKLEMEKLGKPIYEVILRCNK